MKKVFFFITIFIVSSLSICSAQSVLKTAGILPDPTAKVGTWTEYQTILDGSGAELYKYRVRLKSAKKFSGESSECTFEVELINLTKDYLGADIVYEYDQRLSGNYSSEKGERRAFLAKGKKWNYELLVFNDKTKEQKQFEPCFNCDFSYTIVSSR